MNSVSPSFGSRNRNIKKGRGRVTGPRAWQCTAQFRASSARDRVDTMHETRTTGVQFASISTATFAKETGLEKSILETRRWSDIHRTRGEAVNLKARNDTDTPIRGCGKTFRMLIGRHWYSGMGGFRIGGLWWEIVLLRGGCAMNNVNFQICNCFEASVIDWFCFYTFLFSRELKFWMGIQRI